MTTPLYVIAGSVPPGNRVIQFHGDSDESATRLLINIPRFRYAGFDLSVPAVPSRGEDDSIELSSDRKLLRLYQDGTLLFRARADQEFLGWGMDPEDFRRFPRLNPVAVAEVHASFVYVYRQIVSRLKEPPARVVVKLALKGGAWNGHRLFLSRYYERGSVDLAFVEKYALQTDPANGQVDISLDELNENPDRAGYRLLAEFASWFDMPEGEISFTKEGTAGREIDLEKLRSL